MRTTVDIPDPIYRQLKAKAAREGRSVRELILREAEAALRRPSAKPRRKLRHPIVRSRRPGKLELDNDRVYEIIPFP